MSSWNDRRVLVTGVDRVIGRRIATRLAGAGAAVTGTGRSGKLSMPDAVRFVPLELTDLAAIPEVVAGHDVIIHTDFWTGRSHENEAIAYQKNVIGTVELFRAASAAGAVIFVVLSTVGVYGAVPASDACCDEDTPVDVTQPWAYGRTMAQMEQAVQREARRGSPGLVILRAGLLYGPGLPDWTANLVELIQKGTPVLIGRGSGIAPLLFIDNLLTAVERAGSLAQPGVHTVHVVDAQVAWRQLLAVYGRMVGKRARRVPRWWITLFGRQTRLSAARHHFFTRRTRFCTARAAALLAYRPDVSLEDGLARSEQWLRSAGYLPQTNGR